MRQDFLKALVKVFQEKSFGEYSQVGSFSLVVYSIDVKHVYQDDVDFTRYMAENFSAFEYKTQEEVFTIIKYLTVVLSTTGVQLLEVVSPSHLLSHIRNPVEDPATVSDGALCVYHPFINPITDI